jgi:protein-S-isoprenylcysteine O-methyltransferase Ste14
MPETSFEYVFLAGIIAAEIIRFPHQQRSRRERRQKRAADDRTRPGDFALDMLAFAGMEIIPIVYIFSSWLDFADYALPLWANWLGVVLLGLSLVLLWRAHRDLGQAWTSTVEIAHGHALVTSGVYSAVRHPIYSSLWLWGLAQALLLPNWIAGFAGLVLFIPLYLTRVPREEQLMLDHYGDEYRAYMGRTGRVIPRLG